MGNGHVTIGSGRIDVDVDRLAGGRVAQIRVGGVPLLIGPGEAGSSAIAWGAYPMVPWAGRIRRGQFDFDGKRHHLPINHGDHAMHGVGLAMPWSDAGHDETTIDLSLDLPTDDRWPFGGSVAQRIAVDEAGVSFEMTVTAADRAFPVSFGWHPWFRKPTALDFRPTSMYRRDDDHITLGELVDVPPGPWDDCFVNHEPIAMMIDGIEVTLRSDCTHWVVYDEPAHATCVEPQTGPPDAFNIAPRILQRFGSAAAWYRLDVASTVSK
ncbi:aldose 1-epimerase [Ilumatobacter sp.]|uniref:aldose 1-epimerase n=1 Tax=Ilumatobacter sp. TaxID=1967498 RepID=UPI003AF48FF0